jgi:hypothetical protein
VKLRGRQNVEALFLFGMMSWNLLRVRNIMVLISA